MHMHYPSLISVSSFDPQQLLRIAKSNLIQIFLGAHTTLLKLLHKRQPILVLLERVINTVHDMIDARNLQQARQRREREHARRGDVQTLPPHGPQVPFPLRPLLRRVSWGGEVCKAHWICAFQPVLVALSDEVVFKRDERSGARGVQRCEDCVLKRGFKDTDCKRMLSGFCLGGLKGSGSCVLWLRKS